MDEEDSLALEDARQDSARAGNLGSGGGRGEVGEPAVLDLAVVRLPRPSRGCVSATSRRRTSSGSPMP